MRRWYSMNANECLLRSFWMGWREFDGTTQTFPSSYSVSVFILRWHLHWIGRESRWSQGESVGTCERLHLSPGDDKDDGVFIPSAQNEHLLPFILPWGQGWLTMTSWQPEDPLMHVSARQRCSSVIFRETSRARPRPAMMMKGMSVIMRATCREFLVILDCLPYQ